MDPESVYQTAVSLGRAGHHVASLPYYRRALINVRENFWQLHFNYGSALYNVTLQLEDRHGVPVAVTRSSWERMELMREAMRQFAVAERLARDPRDLAFVRSSRARMLWLWGLPWETFTAYREAQFANPADQGLAVQADRYMDLMQDPVGSGLLEPGLGAHPAR
jgi:hypothetical protein